MLEDYRYLEDTWIDINELEEFIRIYAHGNTDILFEDREYNKSTGRNYKKDYEQFQSSPEQIADRSSRNSARREAENQGRVKRGDGKDVHHRNGNTRDNRRRNLIAVPASKNRSRRI